MTVERTVHHFPLDPASRQVRLALGEKRLAFSEVQERYWERLSGVMDRVLRMDRSSGEELDENLDESGEPA